ncbi:unnamed protein product [Timema podura]|uniref:Uncharacterized protein n=1 Tax=Timema podura TaxID=61482 RepID=A0ABN7P3P4_TIMPD|nr:unnamed protein product [Timema podura]
MEEMSLTSFVSDVTIRARNHIGVAEEMAHLAPHGVPSNPIPRALSSSRLHELAGPESGYGATYQTSGGNLDIPGQTGGGAPTNPFLQNGGTGGFNYRHGGPQEPEEEIIRRNFQGMPTSAGRLADSGVKSRALWKAKRGRVPGA